MKQNIYHLSLILADRADSTEGVEQEYYLESIVLLGDLAGLSIKEIITFFWDKRENSKGLRRKVYLMICAMFQSFAFSFRDGDEFEQMLFNSMEIVHSENESRLSLLGFNEAFKGARVRDFCSPLESEHRKGALGALCYGDSFNERNPLKPKYFNFHEYEVNCSKFGIAVELLNYYPFLSEVIIGVTKESSVGSYKMVRIKANLSDYSEITKNGYKTFPFRAIMNNEFVLPVQEKVITQIVSNGNFALISGLYFDYSISLKSQKTNSCCEDSPPSNFNCE